MERSKLISQLRHALRLATNPNVEVIEFDIGDTTFEFELEHDYPR